MKIREYYNDLIKLINKSKNIIILSKGGEYDFSNDLAKNDTLYIGIKQAIMNLPRKDVLVMNDYEGLFGLEDIISEIKIIICPTIIHYKHEEHADSNNKFTEYLRINNFKGKILNYCKNGKCKDSLIAYHPLDSGAVIFNILNRLKCLNKNIKIYGLYESINDNLKIMNKIKNVNVIDKFKEDYKSYLERVINRKKEMNIEHICRSNNSIKESFKKKKKKIYKINDELFKNNTIIWY